MVLFGLFVVAWCADRFNLKSRMLVFRFTTSHAESVATEVQRILASLKIPAQHFRVSMTGTNSIVEFEAVGIPKQQDHPVAQLNPPAPLPVVLPPPAPH